MQLEAVVQAIMLLPQLSQRASDFALTHSEMSLEAAQGGPTTLLHLAAQKQLHDVAEYALRIGQTPRAQHKIVLLNPPEECRASSPLESTPSPHSCERMRMPDTYTLLCACAGSYEHPRAAGESSVIGMEGWQSYKHVGGQNQRSWLQIDAGRKVHVMGWKTVVDGPSDSHSFHFKVSNDGKKWLQNIHHRVNHHNHCELQERSLAHARYFRFEPCDNIGSKFRVGLLVLDDQGAHLVGPRYVRDHSPLHIAATAGDVKMITMLLDHGADPEMLAGCWHPAQGQAKLSGGQTALQLAASASSLPAVQALVDRGATVHEHSFAVPKGKEGDLVAGYLQTNGSRPVSRV